MEKEGTGGTGEATGGARGARRAGVQAEHCRRSCK